MAGPDCAGLRDQIVGVVAKSGRALIVELVFGGYATGPAELVVLQVDVTDFMTCKGHGAGACGEGHRPCAVIVVGELNISCANTEIVVLVVFKVDRDIVAVLEAFEEDQTIGEGADFGIAVEDEVIAAAACDVIGVVA